MAKQTPLEKLTARLEAGRTVAATLNQTAKEASKKNFKLITALAMRISHCNSKWNGFIATNATSEIDGRKYTAVGTLWKCGSKLCPSCLADHAARNRRKLRRSLAKQKPQKGDRYYFATFTIKNPGLTLLETREIVNRAWSLFRKRSLCVELVRGGVKTEEFTLTANGFHYHLHMIMLAKFLLYNEVRRTWTECVAKAFAEAGHELNVDTKDGWLICKMLPITPTEKSVQEVCKYITKSDSWTKMRARDLNQIALIRKWFRMFEMFGSFSERSELPNIVHTRDASDGEAVARNDYWRDIVERVTLESYEKILFDTWNEVRLKRLHMLELRWPDATIEIGVT